MNHKNLEAWNSAMKLVKEIYTITKEVPSDERYGLTSQMRRAAVSIPSNIAEGAARKSDKEFMQFLYNSLGSTSELETQLIICSELDYLDIPESLDTELKYTRQLILGLIKYLSSKS